jgi:hypothetical protein
LYQIELLRALEKVRGFPQLTMISEEGRSMPDASVNVKVTAEASGLHPAAMPASTALHDRVASRLFSFISML